jgi:Uma2 family endonuclease
VDNRFRLIARTVFEMDGAMTAEQQVTQPRWPRPPEGGYTVDDLFTLPDLPPHTELIDGSLVFMAAQNVFHSTAVDLLTQSLRRAAPAWARVFREMLIKLTDQTGFEPDVLVVKNSSVCGPEQATFSPTDLVLAIEVVSPSSVERDRDTKPHKYAGVGIPYFWRIERDGNRIVAFTFELDPEFAGYRQTGAFVDQLSVDQPFPVTIDLTEADR